MSTTVRSSEDLNRLVFNLVRFEQQGPVFIRNVAEKIAQEEFIIPIKQKMMEKNYSQKIINGTEIKDVTVDGSGFVQVSIISEYVTETGFDVAKAREEGTRDHLVRPRDPNGVLRFVLKTGEVLFRKFARVKGIESSHIIRDIVRLRFPIFQQRLTDEIIQFYNNTVKS